MFAHKRDTTMCIKTKIAFTGILLAAATALSATTAAVSETPEERQGCIGDAFQFCQKEIPDRNRVFACLTGNRNVISAACHAVIAPYLPPDPQPKGKSMLKGRSL